MESGGLEADVPSQADPTTARAANRLGGAWGRYAGNTSRWWTPLRVLLVLLGISLAFGYTEKAPCANGDWVGSKQYTHACYSDVVPLWGAERLDVGNVPYRDNAVEYPVIVGGFMWMTTGLTNAAHHVLSKVSDLELFGGISCLLLAICAIFVLAGTVGAAGRRPYDAAIFALSPLLVFHAFSNWDLLAMAFASCGMWAWAKQRPVAAGALFGLGTAAKLYPGLLLVPLWILAVRTGRYRQAVWATGSALLVWGAVNLPTHWAYYSGWREFYSFSETRASEASTFWYIGHFLATLHVNGGNPGSFTPWGWAVAVALIAALLGVVVLGLKAPSRPRIAQLAFLTVLAFLFTTKVWSPQYSLWLVPLVALARPKWRLNIIWQFSEVAVWIVTLLVLLAGNDPNKGLPYSALMIALLIRDGFLIAMAALIVREMWDPSSDVVRASGMDDPGGGIYDGAPDGGLIARQFLMPGDRLIDGAPLQTRQPEVVVYSADRR